MSSLSSAYADALFEIAQEENSLDELYNESLTLKEILKENKEFLNFLNTPTVTKEEKKDFVDKIFKDKINSNLLNYIKVMIQRKNTAEIVDSFVDFEKMYNKYNNIEKAVVTTAIPMRDELKNRLVEKLEKITGKKIVLTNKVDADCIGGVVLEFNDVQYNDSISEKLNILKKQLKQIN